jgi:hypothetical protein
MVRNVIGFKILFVFFMVFNATFNNISVISWSGLLVEETGGPENHRPVASHWQTLSQNVVHLALIEIRTPEYLSSRGAVVAVIVGFTTTCNKCLSPLMWVRISIRARCTTFCDKVCQWLATGRWFILISWSYQVNLKNSVNW